VSDTLRETASNNLVFVHFASFLVTLAVAANMAWNSAGSIISRGNLECFQGM